MAAGVAIARVELDAAGLRRAAAQSRDAGAARRIATTIWKWPACLTVWQFLRQNYLANRVFDSYEAIVDACCNDWNKFTAQPERITSIATRDWARSKNNAAGMIP
jgi:hypothetical protein